MFWSCRTHGRDEKCTHSFSRKTWRRNHLQVLDLDGKIILKCTLNEYDMMAWTGYIFLKIVTGGGLL
jgi:hypothetical protein